MQPTSHLAMKVSSGGARFGRLFVFVPAFLLCTAHAADTHTVVIREFRFEPAELQIKAGDTVVWKNDEKRTSHSVLFLERPIPESERFFPGESWQMQFKEAGEYPYRCGPHPEMRARIVVLKP